jgi:hypothetical protein
MGNSQLDTIATNDCGNQEAASRRRFEVYMGSWLSSPLQADESDLEHIYRILIQLAFDLTGWTEDYLRIIMA